MSPDNSEPENGLSRSGSPVSETRSRSASPLNNSNEINKSTTSLNSDASNRSGSASPIPDESFEATEPNNASSPTQLRTSKSRSRSPTPNDGINIRSPSRSVSRSPTTERKSRSRTPPSKSGSASPKSPAGLYKKRNASIEIV